MNKKIQLYLLGMMFGLCFSKNLRAGSTSHAMLHLHEYCDWMDEFGHILDVEKGNKREIFFTERVENE